MAVQVKLFSEEKSKKRLPLNSNLLLFHLQFQKLHPNMSFTSVKRNALIAKKNRVYGSKINLVLRNHVFLSHSNGKGDYS